MSTTEPPEDQQAPEGGPPPHNRKAVFSVVVGVIAFALIYVSPTAALLVALPSLTSGVHARREVAASKGAETGDSTAVIGLMVGAGAIVTVVLSWLLPVLSGG